MADPGFEEGGFQVCGESPHGWVGSCRVSGSCAMHASGVWGHAPPSPENFCEMDALRSVFLHSGGAYIAEGRILVSLVYCTITAVAQMLTWVNPCP